MGLFAAVFAALGRTIIRYSRIANVERGHGARRGLEPSPLQRAASDNERSRSTQ